MLLRRVAGGDREAFGLLFDRYYNKVLSQALTYRKSYSAAEDAAQEIFLKVWHHRERLTAVRNFSNYLFILTRNEIIDALRKKAVELSRGEPPSDLAEEFMTPERQMDYRETHALIMRGLHELPPQQREVFRLSRLEGRSNDEIARMLGIAKTTVRWHLVAALSALRAYVTRHLLWVAVGGSLELLRRLLEKK